MKRLWSQADDTRLTELMHSGKTASEIAYMMRRTEAAIRRRVILLNLSFDEVKGVASTGRRCRRYCPGHDDCMLRADVEHTLCICRNSSCFCHSPERYAEAKRERRLEANEQTTS